MTTHVIDRSKPWVPSANTIGARLALVRQAMGWNVKEAAMACGLAPQSWRNWEDGKKPQDYIDVCRSIAARTGADFDWLLRGDESGAIKPIFWSPSYGVSPPAGLMATAA